MERVIRRRSDLNRDVLRQDEIGPNQIASQVYKSMLFFLLYMLYESTIFMTLLSTGVLTHLFFTSLSQSNIHLLGIFSFIGSYYSVVHMCLLFKLLQDYVEQKVVVPQLDTYIREIPSFKCASSWLALFLAGISFVVMFTLFHIKCRTLTNGFNSDQLVSTFYIVSLCYILYFNVGRCISNSERSTALHQMVQNFLNIAMGSVILKFGQICGTILTYDGVKVKPTTIAFAAVIIVITLIFVYIKKVAFDNLGMGSGTKWTEILWFSLVTDFLLKCYFDMKEFEDIDSQIIKFQIGMSYLLYHTTRVVATDFVKVHLTL